MKLQFWSIGKANEAIIANAVELFTARIQNYYPVEWKIVPGPKPSASTTPEEIKRLEGEKILSLLKPADFLILLDERGKMTTSEEFSQLIQRCANESRKDVIFLIGGAYGVSESVKLRSNFIWSLSKLVFPHQLVRAILAEQVYRACTILRNEKYHHS